jgi:hypothetical protein
MKLTAIKLTGAALAAVVLSGCAGGSGGSTGSAPSVTSRAEQACLNRARASSVPGAHVIRAEFSQANTLVTIGDNVGGRYRCLSSNDGVVADFSLL